MSKCLVCDYNLINVSYKNGYYYDCISCGKFNLSDIANSDVGATIIKYTEKKPYIRQLLSHNIRKSNIDGYVTFNLETLELIATNNELPNAFEQANNLILYIGKNSYDPSKFLDINNLSLISAIGCYDNDGLKYVSNHLSEEKFLEQKSISILDMPSGSIPGYNISNRLTFKGWRKFEELRIEDKDSKNAFMAMKFPGKDLPAPYPPYIEWQAVYEQFKISVKETGFILDNPLLTAPEAGGIDNRMAVEIRKSKFLVADLSHDNPGAYWEAGFAQGLGKKVFYTCKEGIKTHFDTNHHTTIFWENGKEQEAAEKLRDAIRNTFPGEAT